MAADPKPPVAPDQPTDAVPQDPEVADQDAVTELPIDEAGDADGQPI